MVLHFKESGNRAWDTAYFQIDLASQQGNVEAIRSIVQSHPIFLRRACNTLANKAHEWDALAATHPPDLFLRTLEVLLDAYEPNRDSEALKPLTSDRVTQLALKDPRLEWPSRLCLLHAYVSSRNIKNLTWFSEAANEVVMSVLQSCSGSVPPTGRLWRVCSALADERALHEETRGRLSLLTGERTSQNNMALAKLWAFRKSTPQTSIQSLLHRIILKPHLMGRDWAGIIAAAAEITRDTSSLVNLFNAVSSSPIVKNASWIEIAASVLSSGSSLSMNDETCNGRSRDGIGIRHAIVAFIEDRIAHGDRLRGEMEIVDLRRLLDRTGVDPVDIFLRIASRFSHQSRTLNYPSHFPGITLRGRALSLALSALSPPLHGHLQRLWATKGPLPAFDLFLVAADSSESSLQLQAEDWLTDRLSSSDLQSESIMNGLIQSIPHVSKQILDTIRRVILKVNMDVNGKGITKAVNDALCLTSVSDNPEDISLFQAAETMLLKVSSEKGRQSAGSSCDCEDNSRELCDMCWSLLRFCTYRDHPEAALLLGRLLNFLSESVKESLRMWLVPPPPYLVKDDDANLLNPVRLKVCLRKLLPGDHHIARRPSPGYVPDVWAVSEAIVKAVNHRVRVSSDTDAAKKGEEVACILLGVKKWLPWEPFSQSVGSLTRKGSRFQAIIMCRLLHRVWGGPENIIKPLLAAFPERNGLLFPTTKADNTGDDNRLEGFVSAASNNTTTCGSSSYTTDGSNGYCISSRGVNDGQFCHSVPVDKPIPAQHHTPLWIELVEWWFNPPPPGCVSSSSGKDDISLLQQQTIPSSSSISVATATWLIRERLQTTMCCPRPSCPEWLKLNVEKGDEHSDGSEEPVVYFSGADVFLSEVNEVCLPPWVDVLQFLMYGGGTRNNKKIYVWELWFILSRLGDAYRKNQFGGSAEKLLSAWLIALTQGVEKGDDESFGISFSVMNKCFVRAVHRWGRTSLAENGLWLPQALLAATVSDDFKMNRLNAVMSCLDEGQDGIVLEGDTKAMILVVESALYTCRLKRGDCDDSACHLLLLTCIMRFISVQFRGGLHPESQALIECLKRESKGHVRSMLQKRAVIAEWHVVVAALMDADASKIRGIEETLHEVGMKRSLDGDFSQQDEPTRMRFS